MIGRRLAGGILIGTVAAVTMAAPALAPFDPAEQHPGYPYAPPPRLHLFAEDSLARPVRVPGASH
jgi:hypothetical protein